MLNKEDYWIDLRANTGDTYRILASTVQGIRTFGAHPGLFEVITTFGRVGVSANNLEAVHQMLTKVAF